ncbi:uncharacterized protein LOC144666183 [Oculina patagonica]
MRYVPGLLVVILLCSMIKGPGAEPGAHSAMCAYHCHSQYTACNSACEDWDECTGCTLCNEECIASCNKKTGFDECPKFRQDKKRLLSKALQGEQRKRRRS